MNLFQQLHKSSLIKLLASASLLSCCAIYWYIKNVSTISMDYIWPYHLIVILLGILMTNGLKKDQVEIKNLIEALFVKTNRKPIHTRLSLHLFNFWKDELSVKEIFFSFAFKAFDIRSKTATVYVKHLHELSGTWATVNGKCEVQLH